MREVSQVGTLDDESYQNMLKLVEAKGNVQAAMATSEGSQWNDSQWAQFNLRGQGWEKSPGN